MKAKVLVLTLVVFVIWKSGLFAAGQFIPPLSLAKAAQIAEAKLAEAKLPADQFLRSIQIKYLPGDQYCYIASYEPPVLTGWVGNVKPAQKPFTTHYLVVHSDGTTTFETKVVNP